MRPSANPFRTSMLKRQRYRISTDALENLAQQAKSRGYRASIRGPHGTGKSTLLEDLSELLKRGGHQTRWFYLNNETPRHEKRLALRTILQSTAGELNFLDGGESIGWLTWNVFLARVHLANKHLIATTHRRGLLRAVYTSRADPETVLQICRELSGSCWSQDLERLVQQSFVEHKGNCRDVFRACYLHCSNTNAS